MIEEPGEWIVLLEKQTLLNGKGSWRTKVGKGRKRHEQAKKMSVCSQFAGKVWKSMEICENLSKLSITCVF